MPGSTPIADEAGAVSRTARRVQEQERAVPVTRPTDRRETAIFSSAETPTVGESGCWEPDVGGAIVELVARCRVSGTTDTTVQVKHNGTVIATWNLLAGQLRTPTYVSRRVAAHVDYLTTALTAIGSGVKAITVFARIRPPG